MNNRAIQESLLVGIAIHSHTMFHTIFSINYVLKVFMKRNFVQHFVGFIGKMRSNNNITSLAEFL